MRFYVEPRATKAPRPARPRIDHAETLFAQLRLAGMASGWEREVQFHPTRKWRVDLLHAAARIAVEVDGFAAFGRAGRHQRPAGVKADNEKYAELAIAGYRLIRAEITQVRSGVALVWIQRALAGDNYQREG